MSTPFVVDAHLHVFDRSDVSPRSVSELTPADRTAAPETLRERMGEAQVDHAVLVALDEHDHAVRDACAAHPGVFSAVLIAGRVEQGRTEQDPVAAIEARAEGLPLVGVRSMWLGEPGRSLRDSPVRPLLHWMERRGLVLWSYLPPDQVAFLPALAELHPELRVVLNHLGFAPHDMEVDEYARPLFRDPFPAREVARVRSLAVHPSMHLHFSGQYALSAGGHPYDDIADATRSLVDAFGADRTMWGSDWPWIDVAPGYRATRELVDHVLAGASRHERDAVSGGTAARVLHISPRSNER
ncbi:MAG: amidohydrolase family protein [Microbacterium sp.]